ncbi:MAG: 3-hydroxyacyl-CoA dehydrogenase, partial [Candidatus Rokubacteria bacterium]|nr:3-hydroxyacyl-CoA dehydrogenase [Candidatus Rokubacteria bacterium]
YVYGYGFPVYRGGPMFWADEVGLERVHEEIRGFHRQHGRLWEPAPLLERLAKSSKRFRDL